jgi:hypothetical protein
MSYLVGMFDKITRRKTKRKGKAKRSKKSYRKKRK